jgi:ubiquitin-small subunit ribosomal protein S27Ae
MGKAKRKVKTKDKVKKPPRNKNSGPLWVIENNQIVRPRKTCPKCGPANFMAEHYDRNHCGKCGYTTFKRRNVTSAGETKPAKTRRKRT